MVDVMEFADARETRFEHLDERQRGDRLQVVWRHAPDEAVHQGSPAPEIVGVRSAEFGEAGHAALERMAVQVGHAGDHRGRALVTGARRRVALERGDASTREGDAYV